MSQPFELDLTYLGKRKYRSGKMYWVTFGWPWPKVTVVTLTYKQKLACLQDKVRTTRPITTKLGSYILLVMVTTWLDFGGIVSETLFSSKISDVFYQGQTLYWTYLRNGWSDWCETKWRCIGWIPGELWEFDLWPHPWPWPLIFQGQIYIKLYLRNCYLIDVKQKSKSVRYWADCVVLPFDHTHDLDLVV